MTWLESDSSRKFEDLRLTWLTPMKNSTWLWLGINNLRLDLDLTQMTRKSWLFFLSFFWRISLVSFLILCPLPLYDALRARVALWPTGSGEGRQHEGSSENHHIWIQRFFHAWVILDAVLVKACVCFRYSVCSALRHYFKCRSAFTCSQTNTSPYRHTFSLTHLFFHARLRQTCFSLRLQDVECVL